MKSRFVSAVAVLFCCAVLAIVGLFGYSRYVAAKAGDAAFREQLQSGATDSQALPGASPARAFITPQPGQ
jgi:hypothetical protein